MPTPPLLKHKSGSVGAVLMARAMRVFESLIQELPKAQVSEAASAPSDYEAVLEAMLAAHKVFVRAEKAKDPLRLARLRGQRAQMALLSQDGGTYSAAEAAQLLKISRQAVNKRRQAGQLLALPVGGHGFAYPVWQFTEDGVLPGFAQALARLPDHDPWMQARFFTSASQRLGGSRPLDQIRQGNVKPVLAAADGYGEHGAV
jgi:hypothetical protein